MHVPEEILVARIESFTLFHAFHGTGTRQIATWLLSRWRIATARAILWQAFDIGGMSTSSQTRKFTVLDIQAKYCHRKRSPDGVHVACRKSRIHKNIHGNSGVKCYLMLELQDSKILCCSARHYPLGHTTTTVKTISESSERNSVCTQCNTTTLGDTVRYINKK